VRAGGIILDADRKRGDCRPRSYAPQKKHVSNQRDILKKTHRTIMIFDLTGVMAAASTSTYK
jgi:hypothetical protein